MKMKLLTLLAFTGLAFASCNSDNSADEDMDSLVTDTSTMGDGTMESMPDTTAFPDTTMTDTVSPIQ